MTKKQDPKPWWESKIIRVNVAGGLVLLAAILSAIIYHPVIPAEWAPYIGLALVVITVILRFATEGPVTLRSPAPPEKITPVYYPKGSEPKPEGFTFWRDLVPEDYPAGNAMDPTGESEDKEVV